MTVSHKAKNLASIIYLRYTSQKGNQIDKVYQALKTVDNLIVYKKHDIPDSLNYKQNVRVGDILLIAKLGYTIHLTQAETINWSLTSE
jgi:hypothetical protein